MEEIELMCDACGKKYDFSQSGSAARCLGCEERYYDLLKDRHSNQNHRGSGHNTRGNHKLVFLSGRSRF